MLLNLGCGKKLNENCVNVDITRYKGVDQVVDLSVFPWPWDSGSIDGIIASHIIEHFPDQKKFIDECYRVLEGGGFLKLVVPHASHVSSVGCLGHFRTYSYDTLRAYLSAPFYMFKKAKFKTVKQELRWWYEEVDAEGNLPKWSLPYIKAVDTIMNWIIKLSPRVFENVFSGFIQTREVIWVGLKI